MSTKILVLVQKKTWTFCTSEVLTNYQTPSLGIQPRTCGNLLDHRGCYTTKLEMDAQDSPLSKSISSQRYDKTQESGLGRWLIYQPLAGFLLRDLKSIVCFRKNVTEEVLRAIPQSNHEQESGYCDL